MLLLYQSLVHSKSHCLLLQCLMVHYLFSGLLCWHQNPRVETEEMHAVIKRNRIHPFRQAMSITLLLMIKISVRQALCWHEWIQVLALHEEFHRIISLKLTGDAVDNS